MKLFAEKLRRFPDPQWAAEDGLLGFGDDLSTDMLFEAYSFGIFPWPHEEYPLLWFAPPERGVIDFNELHIAKSFKKFLRQTELKVTFNKDFAAVIKNCQSAPRKDHPGTWITEQLREVYNDFHKMGYANSVECWQGSELVGGLYGVFVAGVFCGESMFHKVSNASKLCLYKLIKELERNGLSWMDIQMITPTTEQMGGKYITRENFTQRLEAAKLIATPLKLRSEGAI